MNEKGKARSILVTGGCGFIGCNFADSLLSDGVPVTVLDNFSDPSAENNLAWLRERHGDRLKLEIADTRDAVALPAIVRDTRAIVHCATLSTTAASIAQPVEDFEVNACGTLNLLEAARAAGNVPVLYAGSSKVYGAMADMKTEEFDGRYLPRDRDLRRFGIDESRKLELSSPNGCSKGLADQYVLDYARSLGLRTAVLRMSSVYGPRQRGSEARGWVAQFLRQTMNDRPITIFGDGKQVRDILHVSDAVAAFRIVLANIDRLSGRAFNLGGGPQNAVSLNVVVSSIAGVVGREPKIRRMSARIGDPRHYVADTRLLQEATGWRVRVSWHEGIAQLAMAMGEDTIDAAAERNVA